MPKSLNKQQWKFTIGYLLWVVLTIWFLREIFAPPQPKELSYSEFMSEVKAGHLEDVRITERQLIGTLKKEPVKDNKKPQNLQIQCTRIPGLDAGPLVQELQAQNVKFSGTIPNESWWTGFLISWGPLLLLFVIYWVAMSRMQKGGGPLSFGRNRAKIHDESSSLDTSFSDVAGVDEAKGELSEIIDFLKIPQKYQKLGGRIPKGVLLVGPPGTGKTLLARAVAGEAGVPFFSISGSEFVEMFVGVGAARVRDLFDQAKLRAPCIIFIDELDAIGKSRASGPMFFSNDEREQTLNQLLVEMDGFDSSKAVIIVAATNTPEVLDPALLRPGRFDRQVMLDRPDLKEREAILKVHARKVPVAAGVSLENVAAATPGMVGADLANIVNEAALNAARRGATQIEQRDFEQAVDRVTLGFEKKGRLISTEEKERVAYHELGHTLMALSLPNADPVRRVSIIPRSIGALGHTLQLPAKDKYLLTQPELETRIAVLLGGRGAEDVVYGGVVSTGASDDLERASELARQMVTRFAMSKSLGNLTYGIPHQSRFLKTPFANEERNYSERTSEQIDEAVRGITDHIYEQVLSILHAKHDDLNRIAAVLIQKETLEREELDKLMSEPAEPAPPEAKGPGDMAVTGKVRE
ncbi:MAG TPA: ATP-dependent zinc metalloprotease FtsH [Bryobacteraceae bacterium]|nr:ATP-dependent zinc metalloprotease FtsH [Bryobacteraceae bacterium]